MTILKAQRGDRDGMVNACKFSAKTGGPARAHVLRSDERAGLLPPEISKIQAISDEYQKQRRTAENSEAPRCFFNMLSSKTQGFMRRREAPPLIISGKNSKNSDE